MSAIFILVSVIFLVPRLHAQRVFYAPMRELFVVVKSKSGHDERKVDSRDLVIHVGPASRVFLNKVLSGGSSNYTGVALNSGYFLQYCMYPEIHDAEDADWTLYYEKPHPSAAHEQLIELDPDEKKTMAMLNLVGPDYFTDKIKKPSGRDILKCEETLANPRPRAY